MFSAPLRFLRSPLLCAAGVLAGLAITLVPAASAQAALITTGACDNATLSQPFLPWGDTGDYELMPGGDFSGAGSSWTLTGAAKVVAGNAPSDVTGAAGTASLSLPAGSSAQSPFTCVDASYPTLRMFTQASDPLSVVLVQLVYQDPLLGQLLLPVGAIIPGGGWAPTGPLLTLSPVGGLLSGGTAQVAVRFTALTGDARIDDVFIDPWMR